MTILTVGLALMMRAQPAALAPDAKGPDTHCAGHEANLATSLDMSRILFNELQAKRRRILRARVHLPQQ